MFRSPFRISKEFEFERNEKLLKSKLSLSRSLSLSRILGENCEGGLAFPYHSVI